MEVITNRFLMHDTLVHPLVVGYMVEVIYPTIPNGWRELPMGFGNIRVIQSLSKSRTSWDPEPEGGIFQVEKEYGVGTSLLRRSSNQELILQHVSSGSMIFRLQVSTSNYWDFTVV
ncbi:hypothetical protein DY000_02005833 [Brassica cretica]|uniref:Uncharacterized protein n=1 Tax=Brassica cretica TaxID=69181 RepID=A0ABQ7CJH1_BRACR|nr:hypothetical protein DY000_02005833 [Brassica cretica]